MCSKTQGDRKGLYAWDDLLSINLDRRSKPQGDRKGLHPAPPHPRPYNDYETTRQGDPSSL